MPEHPEENPHDRLRQSQAEAVRLLRERSGLTWDELAQLFGVQRRTVHCWAVGARMPSKHTARLRLLTAAVLSGRIGDAGTTAPSAVATATHYPTGRRGQTSRPAGGARRPATPQ